MFFGIAMACDIEFNLRIIGSHLNLIRNILRYRVWPDQRLKCRLLLIRHKRLAIPRQVNQVKCLYCVVRTMSSVIASSTLKPSSSVTHSATPIGVLQGQNPLVYSPADPLILFCVQVLSEPRLNWLSKAFIIIVTCRLLHYPLSKIRQPRVIAEVIGTSWLFWILICDRRDSSRTIVCSNCNVSDDPELWVESLISQILFSLPLPFQIWPWSPISV